MAVTSYDSTPSNGTAPSPPSGGGIPPHVIAAARERAVLHMTGPYLGSVIDLLCLGLCFHLYSKYLKTRPPKRESYVIHASLFLSSALSAMHIVQIWRLLGDWGDMNAITRPYEEFTWTFTGNGLVLAIVQIQYAARLSKLWGSRVLIKMALGLLIGLGLLGNIACTCIALGRPHVKDFSDPNRLKLLKYIEDLKWVTVCMTIFNVLADLVLCLGTAWALYSSSKGGLSRTNNVIQHYVYLCIRAMALPTIFSVITLVVNERMSHSTLLVATLWPLHKLALVSLFAILLARNELRGAFGTVVNSNEVFRRKTTGVTVETAYELSYSQSDDAMEMKTTKGPRFSAH